MKKIITIIVAIFMLMAILTACNKGEDSIETSEITESVETTAEETEETTEDTEPEETTEEIKKDTISIFSDGKSEFTIVQPESSDKAVSKAGASLKTALKKYGGASVSFYKEGMYKTLNGGTMDGHKIVIDVLADDANSQDIFNSFDGFYYHYSIKMVDGSLYIVGGSPEATATAVDYFIDTYLSIKIPSLEFEKDMDITVKPEPPVPNLTINGNSAYDYTIVHYDSYYAELYAYEVQKAFINTIGKTLPVIKDSGVTAEPEKELEILVGKTNREESQAVRAEYARPNVYYDIVEANGKLVVMGEGYTTLDTVSDKLSEYLGTLPSTADIVGSAVHGDVLKSDNMLERADGTELRVMSWNMGGPGTAGSASRMEKNIDVILMHLPDVLGTNEFYNTSGGGYKNYWDYVMKELSEYYTFIENSPIDESYAKPAANLYGVNPQNILYRKDLGLSVSLSGYQSFKNDILHGIHWAIFENSDGNKFIYSIGHYTSSHYDVMCPTQHVNLLKQVQELSGSVTTLPAIISGDLFMCYGNVGYAVVPNAGYKDAQRTALVNANNDISHGTFHDWGKYEPGRAEIDLIFYNPGLEALKHKVVVMQPALDSSDHCPVVTDFRF